MWIKWAIIAPDCTLFARIRRGLKNIIAYFCRGYDRFHHDGWQYWRMNDYRNHRRQKVEVGSWKSAFQLQISNCELRTSNFRPTCLPPRWASRRSTSSAGEWPARMRPDECHHRNAYLCTLAYPW